jgi:hypothetical protein
MIGRYDTMPALAQQGSGHTMPPPHEMPAFIRRVDRSDSGASVPTPTVQGQPPIAALLEISDELIKRMQASHDRLTMLADRYLGPQRSAGEMATHHRTLAWEDGLAVAAVRKLEVIQSMIAAIDERIDAFERL